MNQAKTDVGNRSIVGGVGDAVSSVRIERNGGPHAMIAVFNRSGFCGELRVLSGDADLIAERLVGTVRR